MGHDVDKGQQQHELSHHRHDDGGKCLPQGDKGHLTGHLDTENHHAAHVNTQRAGREGDELGLGGEDGGEHMGEQLHQAPQHHRVGKAHLQKAEEGLLHPLLVPRAVVVAQDGLCALSQALQGQHGKLHDGGEDGRL